MILLHPNQTNSIVSRCDKHSVGSIPLQHNGPGEHKLTVELLDTDISTDDGNCLETKVSEYPSLYIACTYP